MSGFWRAVTIYDEVLMLVQRTTGLTVDFPSWSQLAQNHQDIRVKIVFFMLIISLLLRSAAEHCKPFKGSEYWICEFFLVKIGQFMAAPERAAIPEPYQSLLRFLGKGRPEQDQCSTNYK